jgi:lipopolysaccharide heptosyltransferase III
MTVLEHLPEGARVAIIRLRSLGDCVLTTPAISILKRARPDLELGVVAEPPFNAIFEGNPLINHMVTPTWQAVRGFEATLCVNLHGGTRSQWMTALSGARWRAGFAHYKSTLAYNIRIPRAQKTLGVSRTVHTAEHLASVFFAMGAPLAEIPRAELFTDGKTLLEIEGRYAVLHPFASTSEKTWPAERFCEVARYLQLWNIKPVFVAGPRDDIRPFKAHLMAQETLTETKALISKAAVFIGNDSGPAHMAAAFAVPSIVMFSSTNPAIWGPWRTEQEVIVAREGLQTVTVSRIIAALERLRTLEEAHA